MNPNTLSCSFPIARRRSRKEAAPTSSKLARGPCRAAQLIALAHHIEAQIEAGELAGYAEVARSLGLTRARLTQVMNLLLLAPEIQEQLLTGDLRVTERRLRGVVGEPDWKLQLSLCTKDETP